MIPRQCRSRSSGRDCARRSAARWRQARLDGGPLAILSSTVRPVQLYIGETFLNPDECRQLREKIDAGSYPSPLYEKDKYEDVRTSYSCNLDVHDPLIAEVDTRIAKLLGIDRAHGEPLQGQRYEVANASGSTPISSTSISPIGPNMSRMAASAPGPR